MKYMLMLFDNEQWWNTATEAEIKEELDRHDAFAAYLAEHGMSIGAGAALQPSETATTLRPGDRAPLITDGPFVELKEQVGGYYLIEAPDMKQAVEAARHCPIGSGIEIRPVWEMGA